MPRVIDAENRIIKEYITDSKLSDSLNSIRRVMEVIWANDAPRMVQNYTDHGVEHSKRVADYISDLLQVGKAAEFTEREIYLLLAGVYLHDIGMQCDIDEYPEIKKKAEDLGAKFNEEAIVKTANGYSLDGQKEIRKNHHYLSAAWIDYLYQGNGSELFRFIKTVPNILVADLIDVCKFHSKLQINDCSVRFKGDPKSRKKLVTSLLRFADELDINSERVNIETVKVYSIDSENSVYWWLHNCTQINFLGNKVRLEINLNPEDFRIYGPFLREKLITGFQSKNQPILNVLIDHNIPITIDETSGVMADEYTEKFPPEITDVLDKLIENSNSHSIYLDKGFRAPMQVPQTKNFVGRKAELSSLHDLLEKNIIIVEGIAGIGKTYVASRFVEEIKDEYDVYWYADLSEATSIGSVMRQMALFLDGIGRPTLLMSIENVGYDYDNFANILKNELINGKFAIFFDNFHKAANVLNPLMKKLLDIQSSKIMLITRIKPTFYNKLDEVENRVGHITIDSWDYGDSRELFHNRGVSASEESTLKEIHAKLHGHPQYLNFFCILALKSEPTELLRKLPTAEQDSYAYLEAEVYNSLERDEKTFIKIASVYRIPEKIDAFYISSALSNVDETLTSLISKFLVNVSGDDKYSVHEIISDYCLKDTKKKKDIRDYHNKAAQYYELKDKTPESLLEASYHYITAGNNLKSAEIVINHASEFILKGFWDKLEEPFKNAIQTLKKRRHDLQTIRAAGVAHLSIGRFYLERGDLTLALDELRKGEKLVIRTRNVSDIFNLNMSLGHVYKSMGEFDRARNYYQKCLELSGSSENREAISKINLGNIYSGKGDHRKALEHYLESKTPLENCGDEINTAIDFQNIAHCYARLGNFKDAYAYLDEGIKILKSQGATYYIYRAYLEYVVLSLSDSSRKEDVEEILKCLDRILETYNQMGHIRGEADADLYVALVYCKLKNYDHATTYYQRARDCFEKIDYCNLNNKDKITLATVLLSLNEFDKAEAIINDAIQSMSDGNYLSPLLSILLAICFLCKDQETQAMRLIETDIKDILQKNHKIGDFEFLPIYTLIEKQRIQEIDLIKDIIEFIENKTKYPRIRFDQVHIERSESESYAEVFHPFIGHVKITKDDQPLKLIVSKLLSTDIEVDVDMDNILDIKRNTALMILGYLYQKGYTTVSEVSTSSLRIGLSPVAIDKLKSHKTKS